MNKSILTGLLSLTVATAGFSAPQSYDFKDPKGVNAIQFHLDSLLEPISGTANGVTGTVTFDAAKPEATTGKITVTSSSLVVSNATMTEHLHGKGWLDSAANPEIVFELTSLSNVKNTGTAVSATANGKFTLKGVTKDISVPVTITHLAGKYGARLNKPDLKGDLLVVRGEFLIKRGDYGLQPGKNEERVNPEIKLSLAIVGSAPQA